MSSAGYKILLWSFAITLMFFCQSKEGQATSECSGELGMQSNGIPDENITSSSKLSSKHTPAFARLDGPRAWCSAAEDDSPYIQILLDEEKLITAIDSQGSFQDFIWSRKYEIMYLEEGEWTSYNQEINGNRNTQALKRNNFEPAIRTRSIRIYPKDPSGVMIDSTSPVVPCLRLELYGCSAPNFNSVNSSGSGDDFDKGSGSGSGSGSSGFRPGPMGSGSGYSRDNDDEDLYIINEPY